MRNNTVELIALGAIISLLIQIRIAMFEPQKVSCVYGVDIQSAINSGGLTLDK